MTFYKELQVLLRLIKRTCIQGSKKKKLSAPKPAKYFFSIDVGQILFAPLGTPMVLYCYEKKLDY